MLPMCRLITLLYQKLLVMPMAALAIFAVSVGSLVTAYVAEHFFGVEPCILCIYQRIPYAIAALLAIVALLVRSRDKSARCLLGIIALAFFINAGIAFYHSGVELHWWKGTDTCGVNPAVLAEATGNAAKARELLLKTPTVSCDAINFTFLGFTMANWNVLACLGFGLFALLASLGPCLKWGKGCCCTGKKECR